MSTRNALAAFAASAVMLLSPVSGRAQTATAPWEPALKNPEPDFVFRPWTPPSIPCLDTSADTNSPAVHIAFRPMPEPIRGSFAMKEPHPKPDTVLTLYFAPEKMAFCQEAGKIIGKTRPLNSAKCQPDNQGYLANWAAYTTNSEAVMATFAGWKGGAGFAFFPTMNICVATAGNAINPGSSVVAECLRPDGSGVRVTGSGPQPFSAGPK